MVSTMAHTSSIPLDDFDIPNGISLQIQALWDHSYQLWSFRNTEDHKNYNRAVAQYKQQALDINIAQQYSVFQTHNLPLNLLQQHHFDIPQGELLLLSYDIRHA
jgi:hypothetical protein